MDDGGLTGGSIWPWFVTVLLVLFANYIAVSETALSSCSKVRMKTLADRGNRRAKQVLDALEHFDLTISSILILTNIAHITCASLVTVAVTRAWGFGMVTISTFVTSLVLFFFAEMLPKSFAKKFADTLALYCVGPLRVFSRLLTPLSRVLSGIGNKASTLAAADPDVSMTEDEIHEVIDDMKEDGSLDKAHGDLISSALEFNDVTVESVLTPRVDVAAIDMDDDEAEILAFVREQKYSRLPVYEKSIDHIIGVLRIRRYLRAYIQSRADGDGHVSIRKLLDEPLYVTESAKIDELLPRMSKERQSLAIVTDHYGGTVGIVTVEDILETLVGEIYDEEDVVEDTVIDLKNGTFLVDAEETVDDAFWKIGFEDPENNADLVNTRLGEWVFEHFTTIPHTREHFEYHGLRVYVARMEHNRIRKVMFKLPEAEADRPEKAEKAVKPEKAAERTVDE